MKYYKFLEYFSICLYFIIAYIYLVLGGVDFIGHLDNILYATGHSVYIILGILYLSIVYIYLIIKKSKKKKLKLSSYILITSGYLFIILLILITLYFNPKHEKH